MLDADDDANVTWVLWHVSYILLTPYIPIFQPMEPTEAIEVGHEIAVEAPRGKFEPSTIVYIYKYIYIHTI